MTATPAALPTKVRQVIEARLAQLSAPARSTVELAAVIGRAFTFSVLAAASDLSEDVLVGCLDECWRKRIIREQEDDAYDFSHDKLREAAYAGLSRTRRRWLHGQVAQALEGVHAADPDRVAGVIAAHYEAARQPAQAIAYYDRAAAVARRVYAHGEALVALERAVSLLDALPDPTARCGLAAQVQEELGDLRELLTQHGLAGTPTPRRWPVRRRPAGSREPASTGRSARRWRTNRPVMHVYSRSTRRPRRYWARRIGMMQGRTGGKNGVRSSLSI